MPSDPLSEIVGAANTDSLIRKHAQRTGLDEDLVRRVINQESRGNRRAVSPTGAGGLMQLMPPTAKSLGVQNVFDPDENLRGGTDYLRKQLDDFGDVNLALAAYNAGPGAVKKFGNRVPRYRETQDYVRKIGTGYAGTGYAQDPLSEITTQPPHPSDPLTEVVTQGRTQEVVPSSTAVAAIQRRSRRSPFEGATGGAKGVQSRLPITVPDVNQILAEARESPEAQRRFERRQQIRREIPARRFGPRAGLIGELIERVSPRNIEAEVESKVQAEKDAEAERQRLTAQFTPEDKRQIVKVTEQLRRHGPGALRGLDKSAQQAASTLLYQIAGLTEIPTLGQGENPAGDWLRRKALASELSLEAVADLPQPDREKVTEFISSMVMGLPAITAATAVAGPVGGFAALDGSEAMGRRLPMRDVAKETAKGATLGAVFKGAGGAGNVAKELGTIGVGTAATELAFGATPEEAAKSAGANVLFAGAMKALKGRGREAETKAAPETERARGTATEAQSAVPETPAAPSTPAQKFYHKDWGEVVKLEDQSGARKGRTKVAEADNPDAIHYPRTADLRGRGNERMVPLKPEETPPEQPAETPAQPPPTEAAVSQKATAPLPERRRAMTPEEHAAWLAEPLNMERRKAEFEDVDRYLGEERRKVGLPVDPYVGPERRAEMIANLSDVPVKTERQQQGGGQPRESTTTLSTVGSRVEAEGAGLTPTPSGKTRWQDSEQRTPQEPQQVLDDLVRQRRLPETLAKTGREAGTDLTYELLRNQKTIDTVARRIERDGVEKTEQWYRNAPPSAERTEAFRQIGDAIITKSVKANDPDLLTRGVELANTEAVRSTTLGQTIQAYDINNRFTPSGAMKEAASISERSGRKMTPEETRFVAEKAVEHTEADTAVKTLRQRIDMLELKTRRFAKLEDRIDAASDPQIAAGAKKLLDRDMNRGRWNREMRKEFGGTNDELASTFQRSYRLLKDARKAQAEESKMQQLRKQQPDATDAELRDLYDHLQNEVKRRREAKLELARAFTRLERHNAGWWRRLVNLQRAAMVSRFATAMRNAQTQFARGAVTESITDAIETTVRGTFRLDNPLGYADAWKHFTQYFSLKGQRGRAEAVLQEFPTEHENVLGRYSSDVEIPNTGPLTKGAETLLGKAEKAAAVLNWANTLQEFTLRSVEFNTRLSQELKRAGKPTLENYLRQGHAEDIPVEAVRKAAQAAQEVTFAETPPFGTASAAVVNVLNKIPASISPVGFPRYFFSSMRFLWQYNPTGFIDVARSRAENRPRAAAKAVAGTALLLTAYQVRKHDGGEKWYELYVPGTKQLVDMRPFGPFALYLFIAEAFRRGINGERGFTKREVVDAVGIAATRGLGGSLESIYDILTNQSASVQARGWRALKREGGEAVSAFLSPLQQVKDIVAQFDKSEAVRRDASTEPFAGPIKEMLPYASRSLKPLYSPTAKEPIHQMHPLLKMFTGHRIETPKNFIQSELDRLKFSPQEIFTSTGFSAFDSTEKRTMGMFIEQEAVRLKNDPAYKVASDPRKALMLKSILIRARAMGRRQAATEQPAAYTDYRRQSRPRRVQEAIP